MFSLRVDDEIVLAPPLDRYAEAIFDIIDSERERLERFIPELAATRTVENQRERYRIRRHDLADGSYYSFVILVDGVPAGTIGLDPDGSTAEWCRCWPASAVT